MKNTLKTCNRKCFLPQKNLLLDMCNIAEFIM